MGTQLGHFTAQAYFMPHNVKALDPARSMNNALVGKAAPSPKPIALLLLPLALLGSTTQPREAASTGEGPLSERAECFASPLDR